MASICMLTSQVDKVNGVTYNYTYDTDGELQKISALNGFNVVYSNTEEKTTTTWFIYDSNGEEVGLYYLQSRYYDAKVGRFLNAVITGASVNFDIDFKLHISSVDYDHYVSNIGIYAGVISGLIGWYFTKSVWAGVVIDALVQRLVEEISYRKKDKNGELNRKKSFRVYTSVGWTY